MRLFILAIVLLITTSQSIAQTKEEVIRSYGFESMSKAGQDSFYNHMYYNRMPHSEFPLKMKSLYHEVFNAKLSATDLEVLNLYFDKQHEQLTKQIQDRRQRMFNSLLCHQTSLDSLFNYYYPKLLSYQDQIKSTLTDEQLKTIAQFQNAAKKRLYQQRDEYLLYSEENYSGITSHIKEYQEFSFAIVEKYPSTAYYEDLGVHSMALDFVISLPNNKYYILYQEFESSLFKTLTQCQDHVPLSLFYDSDFVNVSIENTKKNAILFMFQELDPSLPDSITSLPQIFFLDTIYIDKSSSSNLKIEDILQEDKILNLGFQPSAIPFPNSLSFMRYDASSPETTEMVAYLLATTPELKEEVLPTADTRGFQNVKQILNTPYPIYYTVDFDKVEGDRTSVLLSAFIFRKSEILLIIITFTNKGEVNQELLEKKVLTFIQPVSFN